MTDQGPSFLPGQQPIRRPGDGLGRVTLPGVNDQPPPAQAAPYGMLPGQRHVLPEQIDLDAPEGIAGAASAPPAQAPPANGWKVYDADGTELADLAMDEATTHKHQEDEVSRIGNALMNQATTDFERVAAQRAMAFGLSQVGAAATGDIKKDMVHRYDVDTNNALAMERQKLKSARNLGGHGGVPNGPSKSDKFEASRGNELFDRGSAVRKEVAESEDFKKLSQSEQFVEKAERGMADKNAMSNRITVQQLLLELTGKASRESEQNAVTGSAGKWEELKNKLSLWSPTANPELSEGYKKQFLAMLATTKANVTAQKKRIATMAAKNLYERTDGYDDRARHHEADALYGGLSGDMRSDYEPYGGAPAPAPGAPPPKPQGNPQLKDPYGDL